MMWWILALAVVGSLVAVRMTILAQIDDIQRARDECRLCSFDKYHDGCRTPNHKWLGLDTLQMIGVALCWPFLLLYMVIKKVMFPRGVMTKFAKERQQEITLKMRQKELEAERIKVSAFCEEHGLPDPFLLEEAAKVANPYVDPRERAKVRVR